MTGSRSNLMPRQLEIACFGLQSALIASHSGADRMELCAHRESGGTTPPLIWLDKFKQDPVAKSTPCFVMIRPRGGDFLYTAAEFEAMKIQVDEFKDLADGFVFGILNEDHRVDRERTAELVERARPKPCTFHRAFDEIPDKTEGLEDVIQTGCRAILSSGGAVDAISGARTLSMLVRQARDRLVIIPGGGVRESNLVELRLTGAEMFHSSALIEDGDLPDVKMIKDMQRVLAEPGVELNGHISKDV